MTLGLHQDILAIWLAPLLHMVKGFQWTMDLDHLDKNQVWIDKLHDKKPQTPEDLVQTMPFVMHKMYPKQMAIITDPARITITEATTKAGKRKSVV